MQVTNTQDDEELVTVSKAAEISGFSKDTIRRYADKGILASVRTAGNYRLFNPADVVALVGPKASVAPQSSAVAADSTEITHAGVVPRASVPSGAEDVPPTSSALPNLEALAS